MSARSRSGGGACRTARGSRSGRLIEIISEAAGRQRPAGRGGLRADYSAIVRLCFATAQRRGEVAGMARAELDLTARTWTLPGERTKNGQRHVVPLSDLAIELIEEALATAGNSSLVFPGVKNVEYLTNEIARRQLGVADHWTLHDARRTALTGMQRLGVSPVVLGAVANHKGSGVTMTHYAHHDYQGEKRQALDLWGDRLRAIITGATVAKVVPLRRQLPFLWYG